MQKTLFDLCWLLCSFFEFAVEGQAIAESSCLAFEQKGEQALGLVW